MLDPASAPRPTQPTRDTARAHAHDPALWQAAQRLEASFISEMLKSAGFGEARQGLGGGGPGEEQFASFLRHAHAASIVESGGFGLAEHLFEALAAKDGGNA